MTTSGSRAGRDGFPESVEIEAAAWIARLHNSERTSDDDRGFQRWLDESPVHRAVVEEMTEAWEAAGRLESDVLSRQRLAPMRGGGCATPDASPRASRGVWAVAAALAALAVGMLFFGTGRGISTEVGERRDIALPDGSRMTLNTNTRVNVKYGDRRRVVQLRHGEAFFDVAPLSGKPFVVETPDSEITALGTAFAVRSEGEKTEVTLIEGKVAVVRERPVILDPGQRLTLLPKRAARIDQPVVGKVTAWRQGLVELDGMPLKDAVAEMNRYSSVTLVVAPEVEADISVSGIFHAGDSVDFARGIASSHGLKFSRDGDTIVLARRGGG